MRHSIDAIHPGSKSPSPASSSAAAILQGQEQKSSGRSGREYWRWASIQRLWQRTSENVYSS